MTPNIPEVVEEIREKFERYEAALIAKDVDVLDDTFWNSPHTRRLAIHSGLFPRIQNCYWEASEILPISGGQSQSMFDCCGRDEAVHDG